MSIDHKGLHTKGPWHNYNGSVVSLADGSHVAEITSNPWATAEEAKANARLMAAAPDLLTSCQELLNCIDSNRDWDEAKRARTAIENALTRLELKKFTVILQSVGGVTDGYWYHLTCVVEDEECAKEHAVKAYPQDVIVKVYLGDPQW